MWGWSPIDVNDKENGHIKRQYTDVPKERVKEVDQRVFRRLVLNIQGLSMTRSKNEK